MYTQPVLNTTRSLLLTLNNSMAAAIDILNNTPLLTMLFGKNKYLLSLVEPFTLIIQSALFHSGLIHNCDLSPSHRHWETHAMWTEE